ncbi:hypothetical protein [Paraherbaspirillum soli]|uniref:Uncharacterized protein n=1 Tax=Paraherbaspirillum soli TaxID=631222 RepID=A0ABW0MHA9_9BURK
MSIGTIRRISHTIAVPMIGRAKLNVFFACDSIAVPVAVNPAAALDGTQFSSCAQKAR